MSAQELLAKWQRSRMAGRSALMEQCPNCGQPIRPTARFCTSCGFRLPERRAGDSATSANGRQEIASLASQWGAAASQTEAPTPLYAAAPAASAVDSTTVAEREPEPAWPSSTVSGGDQTPASVTSQTIPSEPETKAPETAPSQPAPASWGAPAPASDPEPLAPQPEVPTQLQKVVEEETISNVSENKITIALFHIERLRQLVPDLSGWSEEQAASINGAIAYLEQALLNREEEVAPFHGLRETVAAAKKDPRDIDVMIALADRATDIEELLAVHDRYSIGLREALIALKPIAVESVKVPKKPAARRSTSTSRKRTTSSRSSTKAASTTGSASKSSSSK